jgi:hypothetical protein
VHGYEGGQDDKRYCGGDVKGIVFINTHHAIYTTVLRKKRGPQGLE